MWTWARSSTWVTCGRSRACTPAWIPHGEERRRRHRQLNVHSIAIQVPISALTSTGHPTIGVWTTASRQKAHLRRGAGRYVGVGPFVQVSRLGNPLVNEVLIPIGQQYLWNSLPPAGDKQFASYITNPALAGLLNTLYPGSFTARGRTGQGRDRAHRPGSHPARTGVPAGIINPTFTNYTGPVLADMLRLNTSIPPTSSPSMLGLLWRRPGRVPERAAAGRRRGDDRAPGPGRVHL